jgi:biopolymer transport protein ExbB
MTHANGLLQLTGHSNRPHFVIRVALVLTACLSLLAAPPSTAFGQEEVPDEFAEVEGPGDEAPAEEPAAEGGGEPAAAQDGADTESDDSDSLLGWVINSLGYTYLTVFLVLSVTLVSLFVMNMLAARRDTLCPQELIDGFEEKLNAKEFQEAYDMARTDESVLGQVLSAGLAKISRGYNKAIEGMQEVGEEESMKLEHRLSYMALIGNLSPMIGLFGTVQGMIASFRVIATSPQTPKPSELAEGISTALFTTLVGLAIAIPAIAAYNILRNRVAQLLLEVGVQSENLMSRFEDIQPGGTPQ